MTSTTKTYAEQILDLLDRSDERVGRTFETNTTPPVLRDRVPAVLGRITVEGVTAEGILYGYDAEGRLVGVASWALVS